MSKEWLPGKLAPPQTGKIWPSSRLFKQIDTALNNSTILWIGASPGAGKTALVASYLQERNLPAYWYRIDKNDQDPKIFFHNLSLAANRIAPSANVAGTHLPGESPADLCTPSFDQIDHFLGHLHPGTVLVLDDWIHLPDFPLCDIIQTALDRLSAGIKIIIISRDTPPAECARLRANGIMTVLNSNHLRLSVDDAAAIAGARSAVDSNPASATIAHLHEQTDGWMVGFLLLLDGLREGEISLPLSTRPKQRRLFDYLACEVFAVIDPETRDFLLKTATLPVVTPQGAETVTEITEAATLLEQLHRRYSSFIRKLRGSATSYLFSPIFRRFLLTNGRDLLALDERSELRSEEHTSELQSH